MRSSRLSAAILILASLFSSLASATIDEAKAAYLRGVAKEKAQDYAGAITEYEGSLAAFPAYVYANKQMGNCYARLGKWDQALEQYDLYLAKVPQDAATKKYAETVRMRVASGVRQEKRAVTPKKDDGLNSVFYLGFGFAYVNNDASDIRGTGATVSLGLNLMEEFHLGYQFSSGLAVELGYENFNRFVTAAYSGATGGGGTAMVVGETVYFLKPFYRFHPARKITLDAGLELGYSSASLTIASISAGSGGASTVGGTYTGSGLVYTPEGRVNFILGRYVGLNLGVGYRVATITPLKTASGVVVKTSNASGTAISDFVLNDGGLLFRLGLDFYFGRLVD